MLISLIDSHRLRIPTPLLVWLGLGGGLWIWSTLLHAVIGAVILGSIGFLLKYGGEFFLHKPSLGLRDIKLLAVSGLWINPYDIDIYLSLAGVLGTLTGIFWIYRFKQGVFPFAPVLSGALLITLWWRLVA